MPDDPQSERPRLVLCRGQYCNVNRRADLLFEYLRVVVDDAAGDVRPRPLKLEMANCVDHCEGAPVLVVYPSGEVIWQVSEDQLDDIVDKALNAPPSTE